MKIFFLLSVVSASTTVFFDPAHPQLKYPVHKTLGKGVYGTVYSVATPSGGFAAMKESEVYLGEEDDVEREVLEALRRSPETVGPTLLGSYTVRTSPTKGLKMTLMTQVGMSVRKYIKQSFPDDGLREFTAASIGVQIVEATRNLHITGYLHNDIHLDNVAFGSVQSKSRVVLVDFGLATRIENIMTELPQESIEHFKTKRIYNMYVMGPHPGIDFETFRIAVEDEESDAPILAMIQSFADYEVLGIKRARIVAQILKGRRSSIIIDEENLAAKFRFPSDPASDTRQMRAARYIALFIESDSLMRKEIVRIVGAYTEMLDINRFGSEQGKIWDVVSQDLLFNEDELFELTPISQRPMKFAWEVMHGRRPDLSELTDIFKSIIAHYAKTYTGQILW